MIKRVLFIASGNSEIYDINPIIKRQADSLRRLKIEVDIFLVTGKGIYGYLSNLRRLHSKITTNKYDLVHAHYAFNGLLFLLTGHRSPLVVSFMGSDTYGDYDENGRRVLKSYINVLIAKAIQPFIHQIIVKSKNLSDYIYRQSVCHIIPNGVDLSAFKPSDKKNAKKNLGLDDEKIIILFLGDPTNKRKNITLLQSALKNVTGPVKLLAPFPVSPKKVSEYYNAADLFVLSSFDEGSPNTIKEAMACNLPIVATPVGDVEWLLDSVEGTFISKFDVDEFSDCITRAIKYVSGYQSSGGRQRLVDLGLSADQTALKIKSVYEKAIDSYN